MVRIGWDCRCLGPGTFVIVQDGIILSAYAKTDYKKRMEPEDILEVLKAAR
jgi:peroxiredoxin